MGSLEDPALLKEILSIPDPDVARVNQTNFLRRSERSRLTISSLLNSEESSTTESSESPPPAKRARVAAKSKPVETPKKAGARKKAAAKKPNQARIAMKVGKSLANSVEPDNEDPTDGTFSPTSTTHSAETPSKKQMVTLNIHPAHLQNFLSPVESSASIGTTAVVPSPRKRPRKKPGSGESAVEDTRPDPHGAPPVWAEGRQALCQTLPYYRSHQSGLYHAGGVAYAFLLDNDCGERPYMDEEVVITRAGGGCAKNADGETTQAVDQTADAPGITSVRNNMKQFASIILIVGNKNKNCPSKIPERYCVMAHFQITDIWAEKTNGKTCFKYRFEKLHLRQKSWWAAKGSPQPARIRDFTTKAFRRACTSCEKDSPQVFAQGWICLNDSCESFWMLNGTNPPAQLTYNPAFLQERTSWSKIMRPTWGLNPDPIRLDQGNDPTLSFSSFCWKGIVCPQCGRCIAREHWDSWRCSTIGCGFVYRPKRSILSPRQVLGRHSAEFTGHAVPCDKASELVNVPAPDFHGNWRILEYGLLPGNLVKHFCANDAINKTVGGPDEMFMALQSSEMGLQRFELENSQMEGPALMQAFTMNFGMPYKFVTAVDSKPFSDAPKPVIDALRRLTWAGQKSVDGDEFAKFNELLVLGYFEEQTINYHDDGEKELGPTVATLSLGGAAVMKIRMKDEFFTGVSKGGHYDPEAPILPGCLEPEYRHQLNLTFAGQSTVRKDHLDIKELRTRLRTQKRHCKPMIEMILNHGDMVVMHGADIQKYYEHEVIPSDKLRFALTCRHIQPEKLDAEHRHKGDFDDHPSLAYKADEPLPELMDDEY